MGKEAARTTNTSLGELWSNKLTALLEMSADLRLITAGLRLKGLTKTADLLEISAKADRLGAKVKVFAPDNAVAAAK